MILHGKQRRRIPECNVSAADCKWTRQATTCYINIRASSSNSNNNNSFNSLWTSLLHHTGWEADRTVKEQPPVAFRCILSWKLCLWWHRRINNQPLICVTTGILNWHCTQTSKSSVGITDDLLNIGVSSQYGKTPLSNFEVRFTKTPQDRRLWEVGTTY